jgi:ABC-2 type transport system permease protein
MNRLRNIARTLLTAGKLGWAIESNWTDPFLFITYQIVRPLFGAFIIVFMFKVVTGADTSDLSFAQLYLGNAFFILVIQAMNGIGLVIFEDREHYEMIRYIYLAPIGLGIYLTGRGLSKVLATFAAVIITLIAGYLFFGITVHVALADLPYLLVAMTLGIVSMLAIGVLMAAITMVTAQHGFTMAEGAGGLLFLLCGAVFTIDILPQWVIGVSHALPLTYWLEALRRVLLQAPFIESLSMLSNGEILWRLTWTTALTLGTAWLTLWGAERMALASGKLDLKTDH